MAGITGCFVTTKKGEAIDLSAYFPRERSGRSVFVFSVLAAAVIAFQVGLGLGAPWGSYAMGGVYPGQFPPEMRIAAFVQGALWVFFVGIVWVRAGLILPRWVSASRWLVWLVVGINGLAVILNFITPSFWERLIWAPVASVLLACSILVALGKREAP